MEEFSTDYIKEGIDGSAISNTYSNFVSSIKWLSSLDIKLLESKNGKEYLKEANIDFLRDREYFYERSMPSSFASRNHYDLFGENKGAFIEN